MGRWYRVFRLHAPDGFGEHMVYSLVLYAAFVGMMFAILIPALFLTCGRSLCGAFP